MPNSATIARWFCGILTLALAFAVHHTASSGHDRRARIYGIFVFLGLLVAFIPLGRRLYHSNLGHYYIGAKYRIPYFDFYRVVTAGKMQPQMGYRDLRHPERFIRRDPQEQRYYALQLLKNANHPIPDPASTSDLLNLCATSNLFMAEANEILTRCFDEHTLAAFRADLQQVRVDTDDNGFNGSPFYVFLRQLDPTIHRPFDRLAGWLNLFWQFTALCVAVHLMAAAFQWNAATRTLVLAIFFCLWDFSGWALNGLSFGGWLLPLSMALLGLSRQRPILAGIGIAWAGALKLFPLVALLPLALVGARALYHIATGKDPDRSARTAMRQTALAATVAVVATLTFATAAAHTTGMSWAEFFQKVHGQFQRSLLYVNTVSLGQILLALDVQSARLSLIPVLLYLLTTLLLVGVQPLAETSKNLARIILLLLALLGWVLGNWFNYYALVSFFLLADMQRDTPRAASAFLVLFGLATLLPEYDRCYTENLRLLGIAKALPFLALPAWTLGQHFSKALWQPGRSATQWFFKPAAIGATYAAGLILLVLTICFSVYRHHSARSAADLAGVLLEHGRHTEAISWLRRAVSLEPFNAGFAFRLAELLEANGQAVEAKALYTRVIQREPAFARAWVNLGLMSVREGKTTEALRLLSRAAQVAPYDPLARYNHALALQSAGQTAPARAEAQWAVWLKPDFSQARELLARLTPDTSPLAAKPP